MRYCSTISRARCNLECIGRRKTLTRQESSRSKFVEKSISLQRYIGILLAGGIVLLTFTGSEKEFFMVNADVYYNTDGFDIPVISTDPCTQSDAKLAMVNISQLRLTTVPLVNELVNESSRSLKVSPLSRILPKSKSPFTDF